MYKPASGHVVHLTQAASVQFGGDRWIFMRIIRVENWPTYYGWCWLDGYELDKRTGEAIERRHVFVQIAGIRRMIQKAPRQGPTPLVRGADKIAPAPPLPPPVAAEPRPSSRPREPVNASERPPATGDSKLQPVIVQLQDVTTRVVSSESAKRACAPGSLGESQPRLY